MVAAYEVAKRIRDGSLTTSAGIDELHLKFQLNRSSAQETIANIGYMLQGKRYARTNNPFATDYFLEKIFHEYGLDALKTAISSVEKHIQYYDGLPTGSKLPKIRQIVRKYREIANDAESLTDDEADIVGIGDEVEYVPRGDDRRKIIERQIRERRGQQKFRDSLRTRYGAHCMVTGCEALSVLEAAHIKPYRGEDDNHPGNSLLLRSDIHTLFDLDLLGIEPESLNVEIHPKVAKAYGSFAGGPLLITAKQRPSPEALRLRYEKFRLHQSTNQRVE